MADATHIDFRSPSRLAHMRLKVRELVWERPFLAKLGQTWPERMSIAKLVAKLYAARLMPFDTHRWEATIRVRGARYVVGVRTSEIFVFHEIYDSLQYDRHIDFIPQSGWTVFDVAQISGCLPSFKQRRAPEFICSNQTPSCTADCHAM